MGRPPGVSYATDGLKEKSLLASQYERQVGWGDGYVSSY